MAHPRKYFKNNVESALKLMDAVLASDVRIFIFSSTCAVYGVPSVLPITEDAKGRNPARRDKLSSTLLSANTTILTDFVTLPCATSMPPGLMPMDSLARFTTPKLT